MSEVQPDSKALEEGELLTELAPTGDSQPPQEALPIDLKARVKRPTVEDLKCLSAALDDTLALNAPSLFPKATRARLPKPTI